MPLARGTADQTVGAVPNLRRQTGMNIDGAHEVVDRLAIDRMIERAAHTHVIERQMTCPHQRNGAFDAILPTHALMPSGIRAWMSSGPRPPAMSTRPEMMACTRLVASGSGTNTTAA